MLDLHILIKLEKKNLLKLHQLNCFSIDIGQKYLVKEYGCIFAHACIELGHLHIHPISQTTIYNGPLVPSFNCRHVTH